MPMKLEQQVLENIEALQNLMLASVTGGARDESEYRRIRDELLRAPGLEEIVPRFVRTCGDLSQFWHFTKTQNDLASYASRREYIWSAFRPLLTDLQDEYGIQREVFFAKGSEHDAYVHIRAILHTVKTDLSIIDPYMDGSIFQVLGTLAPGYVAVRILTSKYPPDFALENKKFMRQHPGFVVDVRATRDFHDRFIILDKTKCYLLGASIKDAGNKGFTIVQLGEPSIVQSILTYTNQVWGVATPF
jgi:hypothetical protein